MAVEIPGVGPGWITNLNLNQEFVLRLLCRAGEAGASKRDLQGGLRDRCGVEIADSLVQSLLYWLEEKGLAFSRARRAPRMRSGPRSERAEVSAKCASRVYWYAKPQAAQMLRVLDEKRARVTLAPGPADSPESDGDERCVTVVMTVGMLNLISYLMVGGADFAGGWAGRAADDNRPDDVASAERLRGDFQKVQEFVDAELRARGL